MSENSYKPRDYRIIRHVTKNRILDIRDVLHIDKLRIELVEFAEGEGAKLSVEHFAEPDALALICYDILEGRPWEKYTEFKGSALGGNVLSRVLVVERVEARNPIKITISRGPGKLAEKGAIQPLGRPEATLSVLLSEFDARRIAFTLLRHLAAYEAATYHARVEAGTRRPPAEPEEPEWPAGRAPVPAELSEPEAEETEWPIAAPTPAPAAVEISRAAERPKAVPAAAETRRASSEPPVESYWAAAERIGLSRAEAERMLKEAGGNWGQAWGTLRKRREERLQS